MPSSPLPASLSRELGVSDNAAWKLKHKRLQVMHKRNQKERLAGRIELDVTYLDGERPGKRGRSTEHKFPFVPPCRPMTTAIHSVSSCVAVAMRSRLWRLAARSSVVAWGVSEPSTLRSTSITDTSQGAGQWGEPRVQLGQHPSRTRSPALTKPSAGSMPHATWPSSSIGSIDAMTSRP